MEELVKELQVVAKRNIATSGISEEYVELEQLIDSVIEEIDDKARTRSDLKKSVEKKEYALRDAADNIRRDVLKHMVTPDTSPEPNKKKERFRSSTTIIRNWK